MKKGGWDSHSSLKDQVDTNLKSVNAGLAALETELKAQGVWDDTILVTSSDFGRTYYGNGAGTVRGTVNPARFAWCLYPRSLELHLRM